MKKTCQLIKKFRRTLTWKGQNLTGVESVFGLGMVLLARTEGSIGETGLVR